MKGVIKYLGMISLVVQPSLFSGLSEEINYSLILPKESRWGVWDSDTSISQLQQSCSPGVLKDSGIKNNSGASGILSGSTSAFQICPCSLYGNAYWNPLAIAFGDNACSADVFSPIGNSTLSNNCNSLNAVVASGSGGSSGAFSPLSSKAQALDSQLQHKFSFVSSQSKYKSLYDATSQQADFLVSMQSALTPSSSEGKDFLSVPYLKFCSTAGSFVTADTLEASQKNILGSDVDVSSYFPDNTFTFFLDLAGEQRAFGANSIKNRQTGSDVFGGALVRAVTQGYIKSVSAAEFLKIVPPVSPSQAQNVIEKYGSGEGHHTASNVIGECSLLEELVFLQLAMMQPLALTPVEHNSPSEITIRKNLEAAGRTLFGKYNTGPEALIQKQRFSQAGLPGHITIASLYQHLFPVARYIRGFNIDQDGNRPTFAPQPVDTFAGALVINNGFYHGKKVVLSTGLFTGTSYSEGEVAFLKVSGGVDQWAKAGTNSLSGLKYRSVAFTTSLESGGLFNGNIELQIEEGEGGALYNTGERTIFPAGIALFDKVNNIRTSLTQTQLIQEFFDYYPSNPWAVVIELYNKKNSNNQINPVPTFRLLGLARLNPTEFPLEYTAGNLTSVLPYSGNSLNNIDITPISTSKLFNATDTIRDSLVQMRGRSVDLNGIKVAETNMNLVKFNGALSYEWGGDIAVGKALKSIKNFKNEAFLTLAQSSDLETLIGLVDSADKNANPKNAVIPVSTKQFKLFSVGAFK